MDVVVSVPLRGLGSFGRSKRSGGYPGRLLVSVPLRGLGSFGRAAPMAQAGAKTIRFPSPCGD